MDVDARRRRFARVALGCALALGLLALALFPQGRPQRDAFATAAGAGVSATLDDWERLERASDGLPIKPRDPRAAEPDGPMHPHPHTPAHARIYRENNLIGALNKAVDYEDAPRIREVVAQYRAEYPEDSYRLQDGYAIIADCLDGLDATTRARAQHFWETQIRSQTRRYVRRHCLER